MPAPASSTLDTQQYPGVAGIWNQSSPPDRHASSVPVLMSEYCVSTSSSPAAGFSAASSSYSAT